MNNTLFWIPVSGYIVTFLLLLIAVIALLVALLLRKEDIRGENPFFSRDRERKCWLIIFTIIVVFLLTMALSGSENAMSMFSFASTLTSIILSVLAIIMTISNDRKSEGVRAAIESSVTQLQEASEKIGAYGDTIKEQERIFAEIQDQSTETLVQIKTLFQEIEVIHKDTDKLGQNIISLRKTLSDEENEWDEKVESVELSEENTTEAKGGEEQ